MIGSDQNAGGFSPTMIFGIAPAPVTNCTCGILAASNAAFKVPETESVTVSPYGGGIIIPVISRVTGMPADWMAWAMSAPYPLASKSPSITTLTAGSVPRKAVSDPIKLAAWSELRRRLASPASILVLARRSCSAILFASAALASAFAILSRRASALSVAYCSLMLPVQTIRAVDIMPPAKLAISMMLAALYSHAALAAERNIYVIPAWIPLSVIVVTIACGATAITSIVLA